MDSYLDLSFSYAMVLITCEPFCNAGDVYLSVLEELDHTEHVLEPRRGIPFSEVGRTNKPFG